ncbi:MAG: hypothetical protein P8P29_06390 [Flavobacteriaceae bacterium]|nr:hypothetical protein [Flavobacteriaceae bacterium]
MIKLGSQEVTKVMKGSQEITTAYKGSDEVWSSKEDNWSTDAKSGSTTSRLFELDNVSPGNIVGTFEVWFKKHSGVANQGIYSSVMGHFRDLGWAVCFNAGDPDYGSKYLQLMDVYVSDTYQAARFTNNLPNGWNHIALVANGNTVTGYLNGSNVFSRNVSRRYGELRGRMQIPGGIDYRATAYGDYFDARVSNIERYKGSSFALPYKPFEVDANTISLTNRGTEFIDYADPGRTIKVGTKLYHNNPGNSQPEDTPYS